MVRGSGSHEVGGDRTAQASGEGSGEHGAFGIEIGQRVGPCRVGLRFRATQERGPEHGRARAQSQGGGYTPAVADPSRRDDREINDIGQPGDQREQAHALALGRCRIG